MQRLRPLREVRIGARYRQLPDLLEPSIFQTRDDRRLARMQVHRIKPRGAAGSECRVQQFRLTAHADGTLAVTHRATFGSYGQAEDQFAYPQYVAVNDRSGLVYVGDMANRRIRVLDAGGNAVAAFAPIGVEEWQAMGLAVGADGVLYVTDAFNNAVWVFEADGQVRARIGELP